jgi:hypothetical protein
MRGLNARRTFVQTNVVVPDKEAKDMRRHAFRALILAAALTALAVPAFSLTSVSADSNPGGTTSSSSTGPVLDTYYSPITVTVGATTINETRLTGEPTGPVTLSPNSITISVNDRRGNNEGFTVSLSSTGLFCTVSPYCLGYGGSFYIPASDLQFVSSSPSLVSCFGVCASISAATAGGTLDSNPVVAYQCPAEVVGMGLYTVPVNFNVNLSQPEAEDYYFVPMSYGGTFTATVDESKGPGSYLAGVCPGPLF